MNRISGAKAGLLIVAATFMLGVAGCGGASNQETGNSGKTAVTEQHAEKTASKAANSPVSVTPPEEAIMLDTTTLNNDSGKTKIRLLTKNTEPQHHATYAIMSSKGTVIITDPNEVPADNGLIKADIITVSHGHPDHSDSAFLAPYFKNEVEGRVSRYTAETFTVKDVKVTGIPAMHSDTFDPAAPTDMIYLFEVDGLRIAHFGDMAQTELTKEQLEALGKLDISISVFSAMGQYGFKPDKTVNVLKQLQPAIIMPEHYEPETVDLVLGELGMKDRSESNALLITREEIDEQKSSKYVLLK
ncbi:MBL fold metallo-hydrolase [Paenibacillus oenotherae]|uniref:MBL fold metallo-hydrolase n=1 Tax=Paenibacillus oenotherae TaxID=1435645 RepID=A0ABS7D6A3_9BACL|nr:MBL fold metallo-hydrolase [Paenibacillus oenotherae]MBW7475475.1 MBL fold metallo-hydrolase [Paenibacillus oenotherae]